MTRLPRREYLSRAREFAPRGERVGVAKLTADDVRWIRRNRHGFSCRLQAALLGVHYRTVEKVRHGETWCHID